ncbi:MAG: hypothetical protein V1712_03055 [Patescibacteria group bacterium]
MKKLLLFTWGLLGIAALSVFVLLVIRFTIGGSEDSWLCVNNMWVKHGQPSSPMPETGCGDAAKDSTNRQEPNVYKFGELVQFTINDTVRLCTDASPYLIRRDGEVVQLEHSCIGIAGYGVDYYCVDGKITRKDTMLGCSDIMLCEDKKITETFAWDQQEYIKVTEICEGKEISHEVKQQVPPGKYEIVLINGKVIKEFTIKSNGTSGATDQQVKGELEECIVASSPKDYADKSDIVDKREFPSVAEWWKEPKPVALPIKVNLESVEIYNLPKARMGGSDLGFVAFIKYKDKFCKWTDKNINKLFGPIQEIEVVKYIEFRNVGLASGVYGMNRTTILSKDQYKNILANNNYNKVNVTEADKIVTMIERADGGFLVNWVYFTMNNRMGFYLEKIRVGYDGKMEWLKRGGNPFIELGPGRMY